MGLSSGGLLHLRECALDKLLGQLVDLLALLLVVRIDAIQFEAQRLPLMVLEASALVLPKP